MNRDTASNESIVAFTICQLLEGVAHARFGGIYDHNTVLFGVNGENISRGRVNGDPSEFCKCVHVNEFRPLIEARCTGIAETKSMSGITCVDQAVSFAIHRKGYAHVLVVFG